MYGGATVLDNCTQLHSSSTLLRSISLWMLGLQHRILFHVGYIVYTVRISAHFSFRLNVMNLGFALTPSMVERKNR
jgi:hypothetical protein